MKKSIGMSGVGKKRETVIMAGGLESKKINAKRGAQIDKSKGKWVVESSNRKKGKSALLVHPVFMNDDAKTQYLEKMVASRVKMERFSDLESLTIISMDSMEWIKLRGWTPLFELHVEKVSVEFVRAFYVNLHNEEYIGPDPCFKTFINGKIVVIDANVIAKTIKLKKEANGLILPYIEKNDRGRPSRETAISVLTRGKVEVIKDFEPAFLARDYKILNMIVGYNLDPHDSSKRISKDIQALLYHIGNGDSIDLPATIVCTMIIVATKKMNRMLVTKLLEKYGEKVSEHASYSKPMGAINLEYWQRSKAAHRATDYNMGVDYFPPRACEPSPPLPNGDEGNKPITRFVL